MNPKILSALVIIAATAPLIAFGQNSFSDFDSALDTILRWISRLIPFLLLLATLYFFWGLTQFILKADDEDARTGAKNIMIWGVVAVFVMISFWGLVGFLSRTFNLQGNAAVIQGPNVQNLIPGF